MRFEVNTAQIRNEIKPSMTRPILKIPVSEWDISEIYLNFGPGSADQTLMAKYIIYGLGLAFVVGFGLLMELSSGDYLIVERMLARHPSASSPQK